MEVKKRKKKKVNQEWTKKEKGKSEVNWNATKKEKKKVKSEVK